MKASELISALQKAKDIHGDLTVCLTDYNERYALPCKASEVRCEETNLLGQYLNDPKVRVLLLFANYDA